MVDWDAVVRDHGPAVWSCLWRLLSDRSDVEDCFQDTFVAALKVARRESVESWPALLCRLATARALDRLRKRYRQGGCRRSGDDQVIAQDRLAEAISTHAGPEEHAVAMELVVRLHAALAQLPDRQAEVFCLHTISDWTYRELGEWMQMADSAVGVTIHRARQRLRTLLDESR